MKSIIVAILLFASVANAEIFTWTDPYGTIHFVDSKDKVPTKYPLTPFVFTKDRQWSVDQSDTALSNAIRLEILRLDDNVKPAVTPVPTVVIKQHFHGRIKRHRSDRHGR